MFGLFDMDNYFQSPNRWALILLLILICWLLKIVSDLRAEVTLVRQSNAQNVTCGFLTQHTNNNNRSLLKRISDATRRARNKSGLNDTCWKLFESELAEEMKVLEGNVPGLGEDDDGNDDDSDDRDDDDDDDNNNNNNNPEQDEEPADFGDAIASKHHGHRVRSRTTSEFEYTAH